MSSSHKAYVHIKFAPTCWSTHDHTLAFDWLLHQSIYTYIHTGSSRNASCLGSPCRDGECDRKRVSKIKLVQEAQYRTIEHVVSCQLSVVWTWQVNFTAFFVSSRANDVTDPSVLHGVGPSEPQKMFRRGDHVWGASPQSYDVSGDLSGLLAHDYHVCLRAHLLWRLPKTPSHRNYPSLCHACIARQHHISPQLRIYDFIYIHNHTRSTWVRGCDLLASKDVTGLIINQMSVSVEKTNYKVTERLPCLLKNHDKESGSNFLQEIKSLRDKVNYTVLYLSRIHNLYSSLQLRYLEYNTTIAKAVEDASLTYFIDSLVRA